MAGRTVGEGGVCGQGGCPDHRVQPRLPLRAFLPRQQNHGHPGPANRGLESTDHRNDPEGHAGESRRVGVGLSRRPLNLLDRFLTVVTHSGRQSRFGDKPLEFRVVLSPTRDRGTKRGKLVAYTPREQ